MSKLSELIPNRVRALRMARGWTLQELAERAGTTAPQIMKLEKSHRRLDLDWIERLAKAFEISESELIVGNAGATASVRVVPLVGDIAAGNWREAIEHADGSVAAVGASDEAFGLRARGDSMNLLVPDGGYVVIEPGLSDLRDGKVYAIMNEEGETTVKRFRTDPARLEPCSSNPTHVEIPLGRTPFTVIGQVTGAFMPL
ncbi:LexA family protein [Sphingomonas sp. ACRSK]|uniref:LexA family protein n=1 Tax=Sphingomonas sp. ACRSK TaxID=2918213 RepID=UPI001EF6238C|nr:LexA family transcriptional regulator [Sphingomonas sp. ACRSK]MCG7348944.1 helix-turn-helix domain-containing protein [Sphingomonas sp. ACRSK]